MKKNYRLLKKLKQEKLNPVGDNNVYLYTDSKGPNGKLESASICVNKEVYVANPKDKNKIPWQISNDK